jgi:tetratricopeptide (TPR) repeat protein
MRNRIITTVCLALCCLFVFADDDEGKEFLKKANAHYEAGRYDIAVGYYLKAAEFDEVEAMFDLGYALYHGEGITQDYPSAVMWFKRAANKQYPKAEYNLAFCYMNGQGVPCNYDKALRLLTASANHGFAQAQLTLSECYEHGVLVEQDLKESERWKKMAKAAEEKDDDDESDTKQETVQEPAPEAPKKPEPPKQPTRVVSTEPPSFDIELDGELHERESGKTVAANTVKPAVVKPAETPKKEANEEAVEERPPLIVYAPGMEPPKKAPILKILYPRDQSFFHTDLVKVKYQLLADGLEDDTEVIAMVDAVKKDPDNNRAVRQANTLDVEVPNRDCTVTLYAHNKAGNSEPVSIRLIRENVAQGDLPRLFCVAIGVGEYHDDKLPSLKLSTKDARDFANVVTKKKGLPFADVQVKLLLDKEATRGDIFEAMEWLQQETTPNDICIFYYAGHGYRDEKDRFYFMPFGGSTDKLYNCFSASDFKNMADDINCKLVVFADACYSAGLFEGNRSAATSHFIEQLRRTKNGMMLYASSASDTKSKEDPEWGNGAFTKALVEAFNGGARQQFDEGLSTQALEMYLYKEVRRLTDFKQTPIFINPNGMEHFNLFTYAE